MLSDICYFAIKAYSQEGGERSGGEGVEPSVWIIVFLFCETLTVSQTMWIYDEYCELRQWCQFYRLYVTQHAVKHWSNRTMRPPIQFNLCTEDLPYHKLSVELTSPILIPITIKLMRNIAMFVASKVLSINMRLCVINEAQKKL